MATGSTWHMKTVRECCLVLILAAPLGTAFGQSRSNDALEGWLRNLERLVPREGAAFSGSSRDDLSQAADAIERWVVHLAGDSEARTSGRVLNATRRLLAAKTRVDAVLERGLELRGEFAALPDEPERRDTIRAYLRTMSQLIDLSGRLRYAHVDALNMAVSRLPPRSPELEELLDLLITERSSAGAVVMARRLLGPALEPDATPLNTGTMRRLLALIGETGQTATLPLLADYLSSSPARGELAIATAETIRKIGLPQDPRPDPIEELPDPPITASRLHELLSRMDASRLSGEVASRHAELLAWLEVRKTEGITETSFRLGTFDVEPGDWLLMRNPSPYNQFTELSPGLFTHVGVVTLERGPDGIQRMVLVDLPERGNRVPATNVETYVLRTLHYVFLRHPDPEVARGMAGAARAVIGNETQFDLNFRTSRVLALRERPLDEETIHTYCAGLLLLCALQTSRERAEFFPIREPPAGGRTLENLALLGLSMDDDFISPTGALFSPRLVLIARQEPMYDPRREVEEAVFDHFAASLATETLVPSPDLFQSLRLKLAEASRTNPLLAQALAQAAQVSSEIDLVSAAKAAAVVETLDEVAFGASRRLIEARDSLTAGPLESRASQRLEPEELAQIRRYRQRHADLFNRVRQGRISPRELRIALVKHYIDEGKRELDRRFFAAPQ